MLAEKGGQMPLLLQLVSSLVDNHGMGGLVADTNALLVDAGHEGVASQVRAACLLQAFPFF